MININSVKKYNNNERGLSILGIVILVVIGIFILSYFGVSIQSNVESPQTQSNLSYVWGGVTSVWNTYLAGPILYLWNNIFIGLLWNGFIYNMTMVGGGEMPIDFSLDWAPPYNPPTTN